ncbi:hypothetical protein [Flavobacterium wongokense]|uniref:hypothetical protein n=1 Tax=Flavobacterium wongokense TaxID=2910674 RepID=UPI001F21BEC8|nr:hypothetical protein [Flavobacterium sp. WG47]MCF6131457.1 hypothetical protein [Flavobacterium sp. WG47]
MSAKSQNNDNQEIDLSQISKRIGNFFENISTRIFKMILFFKRNIIWVGILFIIGAGAGYYLDKIGKVYDHQIIVSPNFGSVDYMNAKIELINSKVEDGDTLFLKNIIGIKDPTRFRGITVAPITDVYKFIENKPQNFELIKLMAEDGDVKKIANENMTSKNYPYHLISFSTVDKTTDANTVRPILNYLNNSDYYKKIQKEYVANIRIKMAENDSIISQIDGLLNSFNGTTGDKMVYYSEKSQLSDVIKTKDQLVYEQGIHRIELVNFDKIVKESSSTLNVRNTKAINGKKKIILPLLLILLFVIIGSVKSFYKRQMAKMNS